MLPPGHLIAFLCAFCLGINAVSTFQQGVTTEGASVAVDSRIKIVKHKLTESINATIQKLENLATMPACEKIASADLLYSCAALNGSIIAEEHGIPCGIDHFLDQEKTVYAARLAVCELGAATPSKVPHACQAFIPTPKSTKKSSFRSYLGKISSTFHDTYPVYEELTEASLKRCLSALQLCDPCWVSYSNARQNAVHMCHAMRAERRKDEQIELFGVLTNIGSDVAASMAESIEHWEETKAMFHELTVNIRRFAEDLSIDNAERLERLNNLWVDFENDLASGVHSLSENIHQAQIDLQDTRRSLAEHQQDQDTGFKDANTYLSELVRNQDNGMGVIAYGAERLNDKLKYINEVRMQDMAAVVYNATQSLEATNELVGWMSDRIVESSLQIFDTMAEVESLRSTVEGLSQDLQRAQADHRRASLEIQAMTNQTSEMIGQAHKDMGDVFDAIGSYKDLYKFAIEFATKAADFVVYMTVYSLLLMGCWQCYTHRSILAGVPVATGIGFALAYISMRYGGPLDVPEFLYDRLTVSRRNDLLVFESEATSPRSIPVTGSICLGIAVLALAIWISRSRYFLQSLLSGKIGARGGYICQNGIRATKPEYDRMDSHVDTSSADTDEKGISTRPPFNNPRFCDGRREQKDEIVYPELPTGVV